jgi:DNA mismatch endonuclease (patch repair protein)
MSRNEDRMIEKISREVRSRMMSSIRGKDTVPERGVRRILHALGFRFRLHRKDLPGRPDIVLPRHRLAIFVHGCFWHRHPGCHYTSSPKSNKRFWNAKFTANVRRDGLALARLKDAGWRTLVVWECALKNEAYRKSLPSALRQAVISDRMAARIPRVAARRRRPVTRKSNH